MPDLVGSFVVRSNNEAIHMRASCIVPNGCHTMHASAKQARDFSSAARSRFKNRVYSYSSHSGAINKLRGTSGRCAIEVTRERRMLAKCTVQPRSIRRRSTCKSMVAQGDTSFIGTSFSLAVAQWGASVLEKGTMTKHNVSEDDRGILTQSSEIERERTGDRVPD